MKKFALYFFVILIGVCLHIGYCVMNLRYSGSLSLETTAGQWRLFVLGFVSTLALTVPWAMAHAFGESTRVRILFLLQIPVEAFFCLKDLAAILFSYNTIFLEPRKWLTPFELLLGLAAAVGFLAGSLSVRSDALRKGFRWAGILYCVTLVLNVVLTFHRRYWPLSYISALPSSLILLFLNYRFWRTPDPQWKTEVDSIGVPEKL